MNASFPCYYLKFQLKNYLVYFLVRVNVKKIKERVLGRK